MIWFRTRGRFLFVERSSDAGAPPSLSQLSSALALLFGRFGCFSGMIAIGIEFQGVSRPTQICSFDAAFIDDVGQLSLLPARAPPIRVPGSFNAPV